MLRKKLSSCCLQLIDICIIIQIKERIKVRFKRRILHVPNLLALNAATGETRRLNQVCILYSIFSSSVHYYIN